MNECIHLELVGVEATERFGAVLARIFVEERCFPSHAYGMHSTSTLSPDVFANNASANNASGSKAFPVLSGLYLMGDLGTGKTSFARGFVMAMPCGEKADIASPSFALCNLYDTKPPVLHCDVYRTAGALTEDLENALDDEFPFVIVEWAELLSQAMLPANRLEITFTGEGDKRLVTLHPFGGAACRACALLGELGS